jgi:hypothetical protein
MTVLMMIVVYVGVLVLAAILGMGAIALIDHFFPHKCGKIRWM